MKRKEGRFFSIRVATPQDSAGMLDIYGPIIAESATSFEEAIPTEVAFATRISDYMGKFPWLVAESEGQIAGYAYASEHRSRAAYRWSVETSAYIHPNFHRRGVGRALYASLNRILEAQGYYNVYAGIVLPNATSVAFHESMGYKHLGTYRQTGYKFNQWHDVGWWQLQLRTGGTPSEIIPWREVPNIMELI